MTCVICGNKATLMCQRCEEPYCSNVCQRKDWQRHKFFCIMMPPLVILKATKPMADVSQEAVSTLGPLLSNNNNFAAGVLSVPEAGKLSTVWQEHDGPPENEFFECRVTCVEKKDGPIWVINVANTERLERLTENIARCMQHKKACSMQALIVGHLFAVTIDHKWYRGEIISLNANSNSAEVRLIDYGAVVSRVGHDIYAAVQRMAELKAFAFRVKLPTTTGVQINKHLTLRLLGSKSADGIEQVHLKPKMTIPLNLPVQMLTINPEVSVVLFLQPDLALKEPQIALLQIKVLDNLNAKLNALLADKDKAGQAFTGPFPEEMHTYFLAAQTKQGYRRGFLLDFIEQPQLFLVYEMDEGRISISKEVRRIPSELLGQSMRVMAVIPNNDIQPSSLQQQLEKSGRDLCIKFQLESVQGKDFDKLRTAQATLLAKNEQVCSVSVSNFLGRIVELGHKYWREPVENGSMVYITHVVNYQEVCISAVKTKEYDDIFKLLQLKCQPFDQSKQIPVGSLVLVVCPKQGNYRAEVTAVEDNLYAVYNIDTGSKHGVPVGCLRMPCRFLENLPVSQCRAKIRTICDIPPAAVPPNTAALQLLMQHCTNKMELQVQFDDAECSTLDLLDLSAEPQSLTSRMLPMIFTPVALELQSAQSMPSTTPVNKEHINSSLGNAMPMTGGLRPLSLPKQMERHYFVDVDRHLVLLGDNLQILVLNAAGLHQTGYVTACFFASEKMAENLQNLLNLVADCGITDEKLQPGYVPDVGEMCLAVFAEDNNWYRGVCLEINAESALILYCDFGNTELVSLEHIKPIPTSLLKGIYATKCFIDGFDKSKNFLVLEEYLAAKNKILCSVLEGPEPNTRLIKIPRLSKILSKELV